MSTQKAPKDKNEKLPSEESSISEDSASDEEDTQKSKVTAPLPAVGDLPPDRILLNENVLVCAVCVRNRCFQNKPIPHKRRKSWNEKNWGLAQIAKEYKEKKSSEEILTRMKKTRYLYEMYWHSDDQTKWISIDTLPSDVPNGIGQWIYKYCNLHQEKTLSSADEKKAEVNEPEIEQMSNQEYSHAIQTARKAANNEPLYPHLGWCGYCKELYTTLCDWNHPG
ncbi:hypothetical protein RFI_27320, partial [Reticulomyxa filosa]